MLSYLLLGLELLMACSEWVRREIVRNSRFQLIGEHYHRVDTAERVVALTFDDGPLSPYTEAVLEVLAQEGVAATFFVLGCQAQGAPGLVRRALAEGHQIGNHSFSHQALWLVRPGTLRNQVEACDALLRSLGVTGPIAFRAPYGEKLLMLPWYLYRTGRVNVLFDFTASDWVEPVDQVLETMMARVRPGSILLLHDGCQGGGPRCAELTRRLIARLRAEGYGFATVWDLLARKRQQGRRPADPVVDRELN